MTGLAKPAEGPALPTYLLGERAGMRMLAICLCRERAGHRKPEELGQGQGTRVFAELCMGP